MSRQMLLFLLFVLVLSIEMNESRFVWDWGHFCLKYCSTIRHRLTPVGICSCYQISSNDLFRRKTKFFF